MILIDGKKAAAELRNELKDEVSELKNKYNKVPGLTVILIGDLTPSQIYVRNKEKSALEVGLKSDVIKYPDTVDEKKVLDKIKELNKIKKEKKLNFDIEVDGGINFSNSKIVIEAGANILVSGTTIFKENDGNLKKNIEKLRTI